MKYERTNKKIKKEAILPRNGTYPILKMALTVMGMTVTVASFPLALEKIFDYIAEFGRLFMIAISQLFF